MKPLLADFPGYGGFRYAGDHDLIATDHLSTVAEVAVALAGFAALVGVLGRRSGKSRSDEVGLRLLFGLEASLLVVAAALLPLVPMSFGLPDVFAWRLSAILYLLADLGLTFMIFRRSSQLGTPPVANRALSRVIWVVSAIGQFLLFAVALGLFSKHLAAFYLTVLYLNLVNSGLAFLVVAWVTFVSDRSE